MGIKETANKYIEKALNNTLVSGLEIGVPCSVQLSARSGYDSETGDPEYTEGDSQSVNCFENDYTLHEIANSDGLILVGDKKFTFYAPDLDASGITEGATITVNGKVFDVILPIKEVTHPCDNDSILFYEAQCREVNA